MCTVVSRPGGAIGNVAVIIASVASVFFGIVVILNNINVAVHENEEKPDFTPPGPQKKEVLRGETKIRSPLEIASHLLCSSRDNGNGYGEVIINSGEFYESIRQLRALGNAIIIK